MPFHSKPAGDGGLSFRGLYQEEKDQFLGRRSEELLHG